MCTVWPTTAMPKPSFLSEWAFSRSMQWCGDLFWCGCRVRWSNVVGCEVTWGEVLWLVARCHVMWWDVVWLHLMYYSSTTLYYKVLLQYYSVLHSTTPVLQSTTPVLLCTTKYYSSTTPYYTVLLQYYKVLLQYYSVLQSTTPVPLCTTKYYSNTTLYYKVLLLVLQSAHLQGAEQQVSPSNLTKYCACHAKWLSWLIFVTYGTSFTMRGATGITLQPHQILRLPRKMTLMIDLRHIWNFVYNARSNRHHPPTSPNTAPATQNDSHDWSSSHMERHLQGAEQQASPSNLTKYCACHAKVHSKI